VTSGSGRERAESLIREAIRPSQLVLNLTRLGLEELPESLADLTSPARLNLAFNRLSALPDWLGSLSAVIELNLIGNQLTSLPESLGSLPALATLDLSHNQLTSLPESLGHLPALTTLEVTHNQLTALPESIGDLCALTRLDLSFNRLTALPQSLGNLAALTMLQLRGNRLTSLPESVGGLTSLTALVLESNRFSVLPESLSGLTDLSSLDLSYNQLIALPDWLGGLTGLTWLHLGHNQLTDLAESLDSLSALTELDLRDNQLTFLPEGLGGLTRLTRLNLIGNQLTTLPESVGDLTALTSLHLDDNPLVSPRADVVEAGTRAVLAFLRAGRAGLVRQWSAKLMVVGQERVGKTSLVGALAGRRHDPAEPTTHGLRVEALSLPHPAEPGTIMSLSVWDFGGQDIYHATHQFFLTGQSVFLLTWRANSSTERDRLGYWLAIIKARAPEAPVLIVATHADERAADIDIAYWQRQYPNIVGHFEADSVSGTGIDAVRAAVTRAAAGLKVMGEEWPATWVRAANDLCDSEGPPLTTAFAMRQVMTAADVSDPEAQQGLARSLNLRGRIVYHSEMPDLAETVVRDPQWLSARISQVLDSRAVRNRHGLLTTADVEAAWPDLDRAGREALLAMLDTFDVSYRVRDTRDGVIGVVVSWLPQTPPDYSAQWEAALAGGSEIRVFYQLPVMLPDITGWFLARSRRFATDLTWRTGALLRHPDGAHAGLLRAHPGQQLIELAVRGPQPAGFFAILDDSLTLTFGRYPGLAVTRLVPSTASGPGNPDSGLVTVIRDAMHSELGVVRAELAGAIGVIGDSQRQMMKDITAIRTAQQEHCPSVMAVTRTGKRRPGQKFFTLRLYCEEPDSWHPLPGDKGCYEITRQSEVFRKAMPWIARTLTLLRAVTPLAGPVLGIAGLELSSRISDDIALTQALLDDLGNPKASPAGANGDEPGGPVPRATTDADFRILRQELIRLDPQERWGGLSYYVTPENVGLYLCAYHLAAYQRLPVAPRG
jgi:internalin A